MWLYCLAQINIFGELGTDVTYTLCKFQVRLWHNTTTQYNGEKRDQY